MKDGGYIATWTSSYQTIDDEQDSQRGIVAAIFDDNGNIIGEEFRVNTETSSNQERPKGKPANRWILCGDMGFK